MFVRKPPAAGVMFLGNDTKAIFAEQGLFSLEQAHARFIHAHRRAR